MCRTIRGWKVYGAALALLAAVQSAYADEPNAAGEAKTTASDQPAPNAPSVNRSKRRVVTLRYASAKDLAAVLQKHFQGEAEIQAAPEPARNSLLIAATPAAFDEVIETLFELDRPSKKVIVDVLMFDELTKRDSGAAQEAAEKVIDERELAGPIEKVLAVLETLSQQKKISNVRQMRVETLENQSGQFQSGEEKPRITGFIMNATTKAASPTLQNRSVGTIITVTPRVVEANQVLLELAFRNDRLDSPEDGIQLAKGENGPLIASEVVNANLQARLAVPVGQAALVGRMQSEVKSKQTKTRILVAARIAEETPPLEKK